MTPETLLDCQSPPAEAPPPQAGQSSAVPGRLWKRWLLPSLTDCLFISILVWLFLAGGNNWERLLLDGDTGWHIRVGESILDAGAVPRQDPFSFSKPGAAWFAWEWLADVIYGLLYRAWGLKGIVLLGGVQIALFAALLLRGIIWRGVNSWVALAVTLLGVGASSVHYLARPHLFTLVLLVAALWLLERDRRSPTAKVWLLVPLTAAWTNLHGGFLALIACLGALAAGSLVEALLGDPEAGNRWGPLRRYTTLALACAAASLINPYGFELHRHIVAYLRSDWIRDVIQEFQSPSFRNENILQFEVLLFLALLAAARMLARRQVTEALWILLWAHLTLGSVRHVPVFVAVVAPLVAGEATILWSRLAAAASRRSVLGILDQIARDLAPGFRRSSIWAPALVLFLAAAGGPVRWPRDFPEVKFPIPLIARHAGVFTGARLFTDDQWADYLIYRFYPHQRVFFDGRSDFYGPEIGDPYIRLSQGRPDWDQILERYRIALVLAPPRWPLASLLKQSTRWRLIEDDGKALLFERVPLTGRELPSPP